MAGAEIGEAVVGVNDVGSGRGESFGGGAVGVGRRGAIGAGRDGEVRRVESEEQRCCRDEGEKPGEKEIEYRVTTHCWDLRLIWGLRYRLNLAGSGGESPENGLKHSEFF
jgi:hypothetical protein